MIEFGREICGDLEQAASREWLVTNGIGGYASGTVAGLLTRRYHGLLIAALRPPLGRTLLVAKFDETATYEGVAYPLFANRWASGVIDPMGFQHVERFHLDGTTPVWTFACGGAVVEKRIWMQPGANTTYVRYDLRRGAGPLCLAVKALVNYRDHHGTTRADGWQMDVQSVEHGLRVVAFDGAVPLAAARPSASWRIPRARRLSNRRGSAHLAEVLPLFVLSDRGEAAPAHVWNRDFFLEVEEYRGLDACEDHLHAGTFSVTLGPGESVTFVASTEPTLDVDGASAYGERQSYEQGLILQAQGEEASSSPTTAGSDQPDAVRQLALAADQFIVQRPSAYDPDGRTIIAGYPWFSDWGRDTMISLPGLTLATGRPEVAAQILRTFARHVDRGMLPNRFPEAGEAPEYNTVDATLWYFEALRAYHAATEDDDLLRELFPVLADIIAWHRKGTRYNIHVDEDDGLLYAGEEDTQLTWMDARVDGRAITPRIGKPVEINALWYNALRIMAEFVGDRLGEAAGDYETMAGQAQAGFARFWNEAADCCYDVIDGPDGNDASLRPNQLLAVSLPHSPLDAHRQKAVVDVCARELLTPHGLRSLAPDDPRYMGHYGGDQRRRDAAYHQGTVWAWLMGPFVTAHLRVYDDRDAARSFLGPLVEHLSAAGLGSISEIFDGDPPHAPRGCIAQAWSVAEVLRAWEATEKMNDR